MTKQEAFREVVDEFTKSVRERISITQGAFVIYLLMFYALGVAMGALLLRCR